MKEISKTLIFVILAVCLAAAAFYSRPVVSEFKSEEMLGKQLFPKFIDPLAVKSLEIVQRDSQGAKSTFRIGETGGVWSIPSHDNYPADAKDQMGKSAEALVNLTALDVVKDADNILYGVGDPADDSIEAGTGLRITVSGGNNEIFVDLIIGKPAVSAPSGDSTHNNLHYVRIAGQQTVYVADIDPKRFPTEFEHWIEKNLLDISTLDIKQIYIDDRSFKISVELGSNGLGEVLEPRIIGDILLDYNAQDTGEKKWVLKEYRDFDMKDVAYKPHQTPDLLNTETLDGAVSAVNDLKIVSVLRKSKELAESLRGGEPLEKIKADPSMKRTGFYLVKFNDLKGDKTKMIVQLCSNDGDIQLRMKDGIRYHLHFGAAAAEPENCRYLFITTEFDESAVTKPEIKDVPNIPQDAAKEDAEKLGKEKEEIEKANKREKERYETDIADGKKRAEKLAARFADWYYVISESVYQKIHLTQKNVFKPADVSPQPVDSPVNPAAELPDLLGMESVQ